MNTHLPRFASLVSLAASLALAIPAAALEPMPGEERFTAMQAASGGGSGGASMGINLIDGKTYLSISPAFDLSLGPVGVGVRVPLNIELPDGGLREEDYDETYDYLRIIRYVRYAQKGAPFYARLGELSAEIGHGTIVSRYMNNIDLNSFHLGLQADVNTKWGGVETLFSDVGRMVGGDTSGVNGGRIYVKPWAFIDADSPLNMFSVGLSSVSDSDAPTTLEADPDDQGDPVAATTKGATVVGLDADVALVRTDLLDVTPYTDLNFIGHGGWGWHLGTRLMTKLPFGLNIPVRVEYRRFRSDYIPTYFGTRYELERWAYGCSSGIPVVPKSQCVNQLPNGDGLNGYYADLAFDFIGLVQVGSVVEGYEGHDATFDVFLSVPALQVFKFKAYYQRVRVEDTGDLFAFDDDSTATAEARYEIMPFLYLVGRMQRRWAYEAKTQEFEPEDTTYTGLELAFDF